MNSDIHEPRKMRFSGSLNGIQTAPKAKPRPKRLLDGNKLENISPGIKTKPRHSPGLPETVLKILSELSQNSSENS